MTGCRHADRLILLLVLDHACHVPHGGEPRCIQANSIARLDLAFAVLRVVDGDGVFELQAANLAVRPDVDLHVLVAAILQILIVRPGAGDARRCPGRSIDDRHGVALVVIAARPACAATSRSPAAAALRSALAAGPSSALGIRGHHRVRNRRSISFARFAGSGRDDAHHQLPDRAATSACGIAWHEDKHDRAGAPRRTGRLPDVRHVDMVSEYASSGSLCASELEFDGRRHAGALHARSARAAAPVGLHVVA